MKIGTIIKELRQEKGLSQMQLASKTGLTQSSIARWELEKTEPTASEIIILANFFNISTEQLLGLEKSFNLEISASTYIENLKIKKR